MIFLDTLLPVLPHSRRRPSTAINHWSGTLLWPLVGAESNEQTAATLLSQLVASATTRCIDPSPLSDAIISMICGDSSESLA